MSDTDVGLIQAVLQEHITQYPDFIRELLEKFYQWDVSTISIHASRQNDGYYSLSTELYQKVVKHMTFAVERRGIVYHYIPFYQERLPADFKFSKNITKLGELLPDLLEENSSHLTVSSKINATLNSLIRSWAPVRTITATQLRRKIEENFLNLAVIKRILCHVRDEVETLEIDLKEESDFEGREFQLIELIIITDIGTIKPILHWSHLIVKKADEASV